MLITSYGITTGTDTLPVTPGNLNAWLKNNGGYVGGSVNWPAIYDYSGGRIDFVGATASPAASVLFADIGAGEPVVLKVTYGAKPDTHFVLATGMSDCKHYDINDPAWSAKQSLASYNDSWLSLRRFRAHPESRTWSDIRGLEIAAVSNVGLLCRDSVGRRTGYDPVVDSTLEEIPEASYYIDQLSPSSTEYDTLTPEDSITGPTTTVLYLNTVNRPMYQIAIYARDSGYVDFRVFLYGSASGTWQFTEDSVLISTGNSRNFWIAEISVDTAPAIILNLGDVDLTGAVDIGDLNNLVSYLVSETPVPQPVPAAGDVNCDGLVDIGDIMYLVDYLFTSGPAPQCAY
jgi:hypothetical protein